MNTEDFMKIYDETTSGEGWVWFLSNLRAIALQQAQVMEHDKRYSEAEQHQAVTRAEVVSEAYKKMYLLVNGVPSVVK